MNPNPSFGSVPAPAGSNAKDALNVPSILLLISGALGVLFQLAGMVGAGGNKQQMMEQLSSNPDTVKVAEFLAGPGMLALNLLVLAMSGFVIFGALKMRNLQSHGLALAAAILSIIPCFGFCCIGLPVGIWALVLLLKPEVKSQFQG